MVGLSGCNLPKRTKSGGNANSAIGHPCLGKPPSGSESPPNTEQISADTLASKKGVNPGRGSLAGTLVDNAGRRVPKADIKVIEIDPPKDAPAPLTVKTDKEG